MGLYLSPKYHEQIDQRMWVNQCSVKVADKKLRFFNHLCIRFAAVAFCPFLPCPGSNQGRSLGQKTTTHVKDLDFFMPTKFHQNPSSSSVVRAIYLFLYIYMHLVTPPPFKLMWAKKRIKNQKTCFSTTITVRVPKNNFYLDKKN